MTTPESMKRLFSSAEYQQMLKNHREDMQRLDRERVAIFRDLLNAMKAKSPES